MVSMSISKFLLCVAMLQDEEAFHPDDIGFWFSYFLDPFPCADREDSYELLEIDVDVIGDDEADDVRRGLEVCW
jgi:hypothetical protein